MILDVLTYLKADTTLDTLLGATGSNSKIYPDQAPQGAILPYITYEFSDDGTLEENLLEATISFECVAEEYMDVLAIRDRVNALLDKQDLIRNFITSINYWFYWCKNVRGEDSKDPKQNNFHKIVTFNFKYANK
jgi:hypothetical protein